MTDQSSQSTPETFYYIEERLLKNPRGINYAWYFETEAEMLEKALELVRTMNPEIMYTYFANTE